MTLPRRFTAFACLVTFCAPTLWAHDLYVLPSSFQVKRGQVVRVSFRNGDSFPESEVAPNPLRLKNPHVTSLHSTQKVQNLRIDGLETIGETTVLDAGGLQLSVSTEPNFIELAPDKFLSYLKEEGLDEVINTRERQQETSKPGRERYSKYAKALLQSGNAMDDYYKQPLGLPLEIIPLQNPYRLHAGSSLTVMILLHGKPADGLQLEAARAFGHTSKTTVIGKTDTDGRISVPVDQAGLWRLHSLHMERSSDKEADWESQWASLTFEIR